MSGPCRILVMLCACASALADVPTLINFQSRLVGNAGVVNGPVRLDLELYDAAAGGTLLYRDSADVPVHDGLISTQLGDDTQFGSLPGAVTQGVVYLQVVVNGVSLAPRERIASVAYALQAADAGRLGGAPAEAYSLTGHVHDAAALFPGRLTFADTNGSAPFRIFRSPATYDPEHHVLYLTYNAVYDGTNGGWQARDVDGKPVIRMGVEEGFLATNPAAAYGLSRFSEFNVGFGPAGSGPATFSSRMLNIYTSEDPIHPYSGIELDADQITLEADILDMAAPTHVMHDAEWRMQLGLPGLFRWRNSGNAHAEWELDAGAPLSLIAHNTDQAPAHGGPWLRVAGPENGGLAINAGKTQEFVYVALDRGLGLAVGPDGGSELRRDGQLDLRNAGTNLWSLAADGLNAFGRPITNAGFFQAEAGTGIPVAAPGRYGRDNAVIAWARVAADGSIISQYGVTSVVMNATGRYAIGLEAAASNVDSLAPSVTALVTEEPTSASSARLITARVTGSTSFEVFVTDGLFSPVNNEFVFTVIAR